MKKYHIGSIILGGLIVALLVAFAAPAMASLTAKTIEVFTGLKVYVNDQIVDPKDVNGDPVDVVVINGTTYLPIRAIGNALGIAVQYDSSTQSAYLGRHNSDSPAIYLDELDYFSGDSKLTTKTTGMDNLKQGYSHCITDDFTRTYKLNGQYTRLTGSLYQAYDQRSDTIYGSSGVLYIYLDDTLAYAKEFAENTTGFEPVTIDMNLTGVLEMKVVFKDGGRYTYSDGPLELGNMALYG